MSKPKKEAPPGACRQCWHDVEGGGHRSNCGGLFGEPECARCTDHYENGCPPEMIVPPKKGFSWR